MDSSHTNTPDPKAEARAEARAARAAARDANALTRLGPRTHLHLPAPSPHLDPVNALIAASDDVARPLITQYGIYLRACSLEQPIRDYASHIGVNHGLVVDDIRAIVARFLVASSTVPAPTHPDPVIAARIQQAWNDPELAAGVWWPGPTEVFVLGAPLPDVAIPLGYNGGIFGTWHRRLADLLAATQVKGLPAA